ncbi:MAG: fused MFS/spermidine synthase [Isosphaeraceae bacterium]
MNGLASRMLPYFLSFFSSFCIMILELVASRLVARHVGASLTVWTSVIGIMLGGICLGNVLGGRLADRVEPGRAVGPLYALGALLTLTCLWVNNYVGLTPGLDTMPWDVRTIVVVTLNFLIPTTVLGMIGPVVAKMAVEQSRRAGSAIGDVYFMGAVGSICGTFLAGFILMYYVPVSTIVNIVAAGLAFLAALMTRGKGKLLGLIAMLLLALGSVDPVVKMVPAPGLALGSITLNPITLAGHGFTALLGLLGLIGLFTAPRAGGDDAADSAGTNNSTAAAGEKIGLADLAVLSFLVSLGFMALEMVAGRMVSRHLGSSIYGWTSVIGVMLGGLSLGNYLGGRIANFVRNEKQASWLFLAASVLTISILYLETPPRWFSQKFLDGTDKSVLSHAISWTKVTLPGLGLVHLGWPSRVFLVTAGVFFIPAITMGTVSPVVVKLAVERLRKSNSTGTAIGQVYAWGMVGSILGTFLTGFVLIDVLGTKGVVLALGTLMALSATALGTVWHAAWAGIPLGLCVIAFFPNPWLEQRGISWGIREEVGNTEITDDGLAWVDESDYYFIKVTNETDADGLKRTLVLDNLIHGYFILGHPERLDYDYEHIYGLVAHRAAEARAKAAGKTKPEEAPLKTLFLGGGAYTFQRYMQHKYPQTEVDVAEIDPAVTQANLKALGLPADTTIKTAWGDARQFVEKNQNVKKYDIVFGDAFNDFSVPWHLTTREFNDKLNKMLSDDGIYMINIIDAYQSDAKADEVAEKRIKREDVTDEKAKERIRAEEKRKGRRYGGFLGAWVKTAQLTFPHVYIFGTDEPPGSGLRETFVVVASKKPLSVDDLGSRNEDPKFFQSDKLFEPKPFSQKDREAVESRATGIVLTDDYAPVENLLAPVAETRGEDD